MKLWRVIAAIIPLLAVSHAVAGPCGGAGAADGYEELDRGYRALYDLDFDRAERLFLQWETRQPQNPLGPVSRASGYLFREFERLGTLKAELFANDEAFKDRDKLSPSPEIKERLRQQLLLAETLAEETLARDPNSSDALLAKTLVSGLRADYAALIEKRDSASLSYTKQGRLWAERLVATDPSCYDAYLALGAENYLVSIKPVVVRWIARLAGAKGDREKGLQQLKLASQKGRFLRPFAKLLLAVAALRDRDRGMAQTLLAELQQEFPRNPLYAQELSRLKDPASARP